MGRVSRSVGPMVAAAVAHLRAGALLAGTTFFWLALVLLVPLARGAGGELVALELTMASAAIIARWGFRGRPSSAAHLVVRWVGTLVLGGLIGAIVVTFLAIVGRPERVAEVLRDAVVRSLFGVAGAVAVFASWPRSRETGPERSGDSRDRNVDVIGVLSVVLLAAIVVLLWHRSLRFWAGSAGFAQPTVIHEVSVYVDRAEVVAHGTYTTHGRPACSRRPTRGAYWIGSPIGGVTTARDLELTETTSDVSALVGATFGAEFRIHGTPPGEPIELTVRVVHPPFPPKSERDPETRDSWTDTFVLQETGHVEAWRIDEGWMRIPGDYVVQLLLEDRLVAEQRFRVTLPSWTDCTGSKECATDRATLLQDAVEGAAVAADGAQRDVASAFEATTWPLDVALCADDCGAAGEYARALETPSPNTAVVASSVRQDAIRGVAEYCGKRAVPIGAPADLGTAKIAYKRLCFDDCPSYTLVVRGDGAMSFDGNGPSGRVIREGRLSGVEVNNLFGMLERIGFVRQADQDFPFGLDSPESRLTLEWRGLSHRIHAGMFELSEGVYFVENRLHAIAMAKGWVEELRGAMNGGP